MYTNNNNYTYPSSPKAARTIVPYAFIRFSNEKLTMQASLDSILPFFDRGILCYHDLLPGIDDDGSLEIAKEFVKKNPGFKLVHYPFPVIFNNSKFYYDHLRSGSVYRAWLLDSFYNFALEQLKSLAYENGDLENCFLMKIDLDHIYNTVNLADMYLYAIEHPEYNGFLSTQFCVSKTRDGKDVWFNKIINTWDHFFISVVQINRFRFVMVSQPDLKFDNKLSFTPFANIHYGGFERISVFDTTRYCYDRIFVNSIHFNHEKHRVMNELNDQELDRLYSRGYPFEEVDFEELKQKYRDIEINPGFFSKENIKAIMCKFDYGYLERAHIEGKHFGRQYFQEEELLNNPKYSPQNIIAKFNQLNWENQQGKVHFTPEEAEQRDLDAMIISGILDENYMLDIVFTDSFE